MTQVRIAYSACNIETLSTVLSRLDLRKVEFFSVCFSCLIL